ncbi:MAG: glycerol-3-phosphate dehydrogenase/oxidase [Chitinophagaceae bacterium]|nr:MAG: glycerol-3-phosphate dehydrogenase/oxidase [Chitinophagaceae bacterium]
MSEASKAVSFSNLNRHQLLDNIQNTKWDVIIIGGGITGAGTALDLASRGFKTLVLEKNDFAFGTSSRSTKLIHGGLRYLKQMEFKLVREVGLERAIVHKIAPHLVIPEKMLLPIFEKGNLGKWMTSFALSVYDYLANVQKIDKKKRLGKKDTLLNEPLLKESLVKSGFLYSEYRTDDARLVIELLKTAAVYNASAVNYINVKGFIYKEGKISGLVAEDKINNSELELNADFVINAAGPWVDNLRKLDGSLSQKRLQLTRGIHLVFPKEKIPIKQSMYFDSADGRMIFAIPRERIVYLGTTDTVYDKNPDNPFVTKEDVKYLLKSINRVLKGVDLTESDIESSWAGLRPLIFEEGKEPSELSRKDEVFISESGLISIAGGKLTGYRKMAERLTNYIVKQKGLKYEDYPCKTDSIKLVGAEKADDKTFMALQFDKWIELVGKGEEVPYMIYFHRYGTQLYSIIEKALKNVRSGLHPYNALLMAEVEYSVHFEMVYHPNDFLIRRTGNLYFERPFYMNKTEAVSGWIASFLNIDEETQKEWEKAVKKEFDEVMNFIG